MNKKVIWAVVAVVILAAIIWWYQSRPDTEPAETGTTAVDQNGEPPQAAVNSEQSLGASIYSQVGQTQNPAEQIPNTNPLGDQTNPIKGAYTNPFGQ
ncbi:MAG TPA: hypothetical protein VJL32_02905 [Candidatus Paceibacterota bacterium]